MKEEDLKFKVILGAIVGLRPDWAIDPISKQQKEKSSKAGLLDSVQHALLAYYSQ